MIKFLNYEILRHSLFKNEGELTDISRNNTSVISIYNYKKVNFHWRFTTHHTPAQGIFVLEVIKQLILSDASACSSAFFLSNTRAFLI
jgi:hypothetical protein